jgi:flagellar biosynthetic protein FliR
MTAGVEQAVFVAFAIFCRVGTAMMLMPGFGSARVPMPVRLLVALACGLALLPLLFGAIEDQLGGFTEAQRLYVLINEVATGLAMGLMARLFLLGLQFGVTTAANAIGLAGVPGLPVDDAEALPPLTNLMSLAGVMVIVAADLPLAFLRAVAQSYGAFPLRIGVDAQWHLGNVLAALADTSLLALRLAGPFLVYAVVVNVAMGLANKFTPQIQMYFASLGLVTLGGLFLLLLSARQALHIFVEALGGWIVAN